MAAWISSGSLASTPRPSARLTASTWREPRASAYEWCWPAWPAWCMPCCLSCSCAPVAEPSSSSTSAWPSIAVLRRRSRAASSSRCKAGRAFLPCCSSHAWAADLQSRGPREIERLAKAPQSSSSTQRVSKVRWPRSSHSRGPRLVG